MEREERPYDRVATDAVPNGSYENGFLVRLIKLDDDLGEKDIEGIKFLCCDFIPGSRLEKCKKGIEIFQYLIERKLITEKNIDILLECLCRINRLDWIKKLHFKPDDVKQKVNKATKLKPFRVMLFNIAEDISEEEVSKIRFYLKNIISGHQNRNISSCTTMVEAFILCEKMGLLDERNYQIIYEMLKHLKRDDLVDEVNEYAEKAGFIQYLDPLPGNHVHHEVCLGPSPFGHAGGHSGEPVNTSGNSQTHEPMDKSESSRRLGSPSNRPVNTPECPLPHSHMNMPENSALHGPCSPFNKPTDSMAAGQVTVKPYIHGNYTVVPHPERTQHNCMPNAGLSVAPLTYDIISEFNTIPNVSYKLDTSGVKNNFVASEKPHGQFGNGAMSTSEPELAWRTPITEAGVATGFHDSIPHPASQVVPSGAAIKQRQEQPEFLERYKMDAEPRGICLIINNKKFFQEENDVHSRKLKDREGTDIDCEKLQNLFNKLHFQVETRHDQTDQQIHKLMFEKSRKVDHSKYDCFVCCVLTHGTEGNILGSNGKEIPIINLTSFFRSDLCPSLAGKPKVFFFQACQGSEKQSGYKREQNVPDIVEDGPNREVIPNESDFLFGFATVTGYSSFRSRSRGSWYISKLVQMLERYHERKDVLSILVRVNDEVCKGDANFDSRVYKQTPAPMFTLRKELYF